MRDVLARKCFFSSFSNVYFIENAHEQVSQATKYTDAPPLSSLIAVYRQKQQHHAGHQGEDRHKWIGNINGVERYSHAAEWLEPANSIVIEGIEEKMDEHLN